MPGTFDYECQECGFRFEHTVDFLSERDDVFCQRDGAKATRLLSPPSSFTCWATNNPTNGYAGGPREYERKLAHKEGAGNVIALGNESEESMHRWGAKLRQEAKERDRKNLEGAVDKMFTDLGDDLYSSS
jgi:hypothetical protein